MAADACDVLVVGGGPAGSTCAWQLRRAGFDVLVMDKQAFPRDKVCAGWITPAVIASLELDVAAYALDRVMQPVRGFRVGTIGGAQVRARYGDAVSFGIRRCEFDDYLLRRSGARVLLGEPVKNLVRDGRGWLVNRRIRTSLLVGAGGHFCPVARMLGLEQDGAQSIVVAQEAEIRLPGNERSKYGIEPDVVQLYFCPDLKGYGWCFAKGEYLNVGLGREDSHALSAHVGHFRAWLQQCGGIPRELPGRFNGHAYLLYPGSRRRPFEDGVVLIGDAAGLAYPRSGEGIRPAIESALMAAEIIRDAAGRYSRERLAPYADRLVGRFGARGGAPDAAAWLPANLRQSMAAKLLATAWFARNVVIDRWFLHSGQRALVPG